MRRPLYQLMSTALFCPTSSTSTSSNEPDTKHVFCAADNTTKLRKIYGVYGEPEFIWNIFQSIEPQLMLLHQENNYGLCN